MAGLGWKSDAGINRDRFSRIPRYGHVDDSPVNSGGRTFFMVDLSAIDFGRFAGGGTFFIPFFGLQRRFASVAFIIRLGGNDPSPDYQIRYHPSSGEQAIVTGYSRRPHFGNFEGKADQFLP